MASSHPGEDGRYRIRQGVQAIRPYLDAIRAVQGLLILDIQPGQADFMTEIRVYEELLKEPDQEMREMAQAELATLEDRRTTLDGEIKLLLLPKDPNDDKSVVLEIRAGTGGDESALFAGDLFKMLTRYAEQSGFGTEVLSQSPAEVGGFKDVTFFNNEQTIVSFWIAIIFFALTYMIFLYQRFFKDHVTIYKKRFRKWEDEGVQLHD